VTGIIEDVPSNTHFQFQVLVSFRAVEQQLGETFMTTNFGSNNYYTYVKLKEGVDIREFESQLPGLIDSQFAAAPTGQLASQFNILHVWPITSIHLQSNLDAEIGTNSDIAYVWIYSIVGLFILAIACINFMNLSTARYGDRMKEIGMRKVMGADRASLIRQFLGESILFTLIALLISIILVELGMSSFNEFANKEVGLDVLQDPWLIPGLLLVAIVVGVLAGSYPALFLSSFQPQAILKGELTTGKGPMRFRSALVVLQFTISIGLMVSMGIVYSQLDYIQDKELGFESEQILTLPVSADISSRFNDLESKWRMQPGIVDVALASRIPSGRLLDSQGGGQAEVDGEMVSITFRIADIHVSHDYLNTFGMSIVAGRDFDRNLASDSLQAFVLNEMAVQKIGWASPEDAIGKRFNYGSRSGYVIGIVKDHHFENLRQAISPMVYQITNGRVNSVVFRYAESYKDEVLAYLESEWTYLRPNFPFVPTFIDEAFQSQYESEATLGTLFGLFAGLAIAIAALGLFGLASFSVQRRMKEMSIRKVMGASIQSILMLLNAEFLKLVGMSFVIASPIVWILMSSWLETFAYHTHIRITLFAIAGVGALTIALITVVGQTLKAAAQNPVEVLRQN
jgi:putative ABC transport system permease protein